MAMATAHAPSLAWLVRLHSPPLPQVGLRGYNATRQLLLAGYDATNISGGYRSAQQAGVQTVQPKL